MLRIIETPDYTGRPDYLIGQYMRWACFMAGLPFVCYYPTQSTQTIRSGICFDNQDYMPAHLKQVQSLLPDIEDGDVLYFCDAWYPGLDTIRVWCAMNGLNVKLAASNHADYYFPGDFTSEMWWEKYACLTRYAALDVMYLATAYSYELLFNQLDPMGLDSMLEKMVVVGEPLPEVPNIASPKKDTVVFPHRWAADKRPEDFVRVAALVRESNPVVEFKVLSPVPLRIDDENITVVHCATKEQYFLQLAAAKIVFSSAELETFGIAVIEAVKLNCLPVLPDRAVYPFLYPSIFLYRDLPAAATKINLFLSAHAEYLHLLPTFDSFNNSSQIIIKDMQKRGWL